MAEDESMFNLQTPAAKVMPKIQYTTLLFQTFYKCAEICGNADATPEAIHKKIEFLTKIIINFIPDPDTRELLKKERKDSIDDLKKQKKTGKIDVDEYNDLILDINTDMIGEVMETCDEFLAIVERQCVMPMLLPDKRAALEEKFYKKNVVEEMDNEANEKNT